MFVFTYGTLRPSLYPDNVRRFSLTADGPGTGPARLKAKLQMMDLGHYPALVPCEQENTIVGEVVAVDDLAPLDRYECYAPGGKGLYDRVEHRVDLFDGSTQVCHVYFMKSVLKDRGAIVVPENDWAGRAPSCASSS